jgi:hypothetical protein
MTPLNPPYAAVLRAIRPVDSAAAGSPTISLSVTLAKLAIHVLAAAPAAMIIQGPADIRSTE